MVPASFSGDALLLAGHDEAGQHRQHGAVHRHRDGDLLERDAVEEDLHVLDRVDGHAGLADVAGDARMVRVVAAVGGEVEGHREALLARREVAAVEGVRLLGGGEARVLAHRPGAVGVHGRARAAQEGRRCPAVVSTPLEALEVRGGVEGLDARPSGVSRRGRRGSLPRSSLPGELAPELEIASGEIGAGLRSHGSLILDRPVPLRLRRGRRVGPGSGRGQRNIAVRAVAVTRPGVHRAAVVAFGSRGTYIERR